MDETRSALRRWMGRPVLRWILLGYLSVVAIGFVATLISEFSLQQEYSEYALRAVQSEQSDLIERLDHRLAVIDGTLASLEVDPARIEEMEMLIDEMRMLIVAVSEVTGLDAISYSERLERVELQASQTHEELGHLKSILNPTSPENALKVLRLGDKFELYGRELEMLKDQIVLLRSDLGARIEQNYDRAIGRVDAITGTIGWMALLLVPVMLGAIRDFIPRSSRGEGEQGGRTATADARADGET